MERTPASQIALWSVNPRLKRPFVKVGKKPGVRSQPVGLVGIFDSLTHNRQGPHHLYQIVFLCRPINHERPDPPHHPEETIEQGWFSEDALPLDLDLNHMLRIPKAFAYLNKQESVFE